MTTKKAKKKSAPVKAKSNHSVGPFVLFGLSDDGKPKGARFEAAQFNAASTAAAALDLEIFEARSGDLLEIAKELPAGRIYARGRAFIPFIAKELYDRLHVASGGLVRDEGRKEGQRLDAEKELEALQKHLPPEQPRTWEELAVGQFVIAAWGDDEEWWACVIAERNGDVLTLKFKDYPKHKPFFKHIRAVALLCPPPQPLSE